MNSKPNVALKEARERKGLTQAQVAEQANISEVGYKRYELGLREPRASVANRIAQILNTTSENLFGI